MSPISYKILSSPFFSNAELKRGTQSLAPDSAEEFREVTETFGETFYQSRIKFMRGYAAH